MLFACLVAKKKIPAYKKGLHICDDDVGVAAAELKKEKIVPRFEPGSLVPKELTIRQRVFLRNTDAV